MHVTPPPLAAIPTSTPTGVHALVADLQAPEDPRARDARRRAVVRRLRDAGLSPDLLEAVLPGWARYRDDPATVDRHQASLQA